MNLLKADVKLNKTFSIKYVIKKKYTIALVIELFYYVIIKKK